MKKFQIKLFFFSDSLIADIFGDCWTLRMREVSISTTNLSLEKLLACYRIAKIDKQKIPDEVFVGFEEFIDKLRLNDGEIGGVRNLNYKPAYFNFPKEIPINEISAGFMFQADETIPLVFARIEYLNFFGKCIKKGLVGNVNHYLWWRPSFE